MKKDLRVTTIQASLVWEDAAANMKQFGLKMEGLAGKTDLVVLPEMFNTGFSMTPEKGAETMTGPTITWMSAQAKELGAVITGSLIIKEEGRYYNRLIWMRPDGSHEQYDKRHLFAMAGEDKAYSAGKELLVVDCCGWRICPLICYDLRFPAWSRNTMDYDLLLYVANWPQKRSYAWRALLRARAIENQAWTIGLNRVGKDGNDLLYAGESCLIDPSGELIIFSDEYIESTRTTPISWEHLQNSRQKLPFLVDRDKFEIEI